MMRADLPHHLKSKQLIRSQWPTSTTWFHGTVKPVHRVHNYLQVSQRSDALEAIAHKQMIGRKIYGNYLYEVQLQVAEENILFVEDWSHNHLGLAYAVLRALGQDARKVAVSSATEIIQELAVERRVQGLSSDKDNAQFKALAFDIFTEQLVSVGILGLAYKSSITESGQYSFCVLDAKTITSVTDHSKTVTQSEWQQATAMARHASLDEQVTHRVIDRWMM
jgi:hypothetical protein